MKPFAPDPKKAKEAKEAKEVEGEAKKAKKAKKAKAAKEARKAASGAIAAIEAAARAGGVPLPPGAAEETIASAEKVIGFRFPDAMRAFYLVHDGGPAERKACGGRELLSMKAIVREWKIWKEFHDDGEYERVNDKVARGVQPKWWIPAWVPVTFKESNHDMIDLAPAEGGQVGQIISFLHDEGTRKIKGPDFLTWLGKQKWRDTGE